jgi:hypothetical protein
MDDVVAWLLQNSGPVGRYLTALQLPGGSAGVDLPRLRQEWYDSPPVQEWLVRLVIGDLPEQDDLEEKFTKRLMGLGFRIHGGPDRCLENVMGKLGEFGVGADVPEFANRLAPCDTLLGLLAERDQAGFYFGAWEKFLGSIITSWFLRAGLTEGAGLRAYWPGYLKRVHKIVQDQIFDIYAAEKDLAGLPKAWQGKPIIHPDILANYQLPNIHDLYAFAYFPASLLDAPQARMVEEVVSYILDPRYQAWPEGFGYGWDKARRRCYGWGWSAHLPGFFADRLERKILQSSFVQRLELMARFPVGRGSTWFQKSLQRLEEYRLAEGLYRFPAETLREAEGYYVSGYHMGLGENRRVRQGLDIESTFRMLRLKALVSE